MVVNIFSGHCVPIIHRGVCEVFVQPIEKFAEGVIFKEFKPVIVHILPESNGNSAIVKYPGKYLFFRVAVSESLIEFSNNGDRTTLKRESP